MRMKIFIIVISDKATVRREIPERTFSRNLSLVIFMIAKFMVAEPVEARAGIIKRKEGASWLLETGRP